MRNHWSTTGKHNNETSRLTLVGPVHDLALFASDMAITYLLNNLHYRRNMTLCSRILSITTSLYQVGVYICLSLDIFHMEKAICPTKQHYFGIVFSFGILSSNYNDFAYYRPSCTVAVIRTQWKQQKQTGFQLYIQVWWCYGLESPFRTLYEIWFWWLIPRV